MKRQMLNERILQALRTLNEQYPGLRFHQLLETAGVTYSASGDLFYEESEVTASRMGEAIAKLQEANK